jgi:hypothetical protein
MSDVISDLKVAIATVSKLTRSSGGCRYLNAVKTLPHFLLPESLACFDRGIRHLMFGYLSIYLLHLRNSVF